MVNLSKTSLALICVICFAIGWRYGDDLSPLPNPHNSRPVLAAVVKFAKTALWFAAFAEPAPAHAGTEVQSVMVDESGYAHLNHARGW